MRRMCFWAPKLRKECVRANAVIATCLRAYECFAALESACTDAELGAAHGSGTEAALAACSDVDAEAGTDVCAPDTFDDTGASHDVLAPQAARAASRARARAGANTAKFTISAITISTTTIIPIISG